MFALLPLAMVIAVILNSPGLWEAFNDPQVDLFPVLLRLLITALLIDVVLYVANRTLAKYLAHPPIDLPQITEVIVGETVPEPEPAPPTINVATVAEISPPPLAGDDLTAAVTAGIPASAAGVPGTAPLIPGTEPLIPGAEPLIPGMTLDDQARPAGSVPAP